MKPDVIFLGNVDVKFELFREWKGIEIFYIQSIDFN